MLAVVKEGTKLHVPISKEVWKQLQKTFRKAIAGESLPMLHLFVNQDRRLVIAYRDRLLTVRHELSETTIGSLPMTMVNARQFLDCTKNASYTLELDLKPKKLHVRTGIISVELQAMESDYYTVSTNEKFIHTFDVGELEKFGKPLLKVVQKQSARNYGSVVNISCDDNGMVSLCGTDGFRLHCYSSRLYKAEKFDVNISHKVWDIACTIPNSVSLAESNDSFHFISGRLEIICRKPSVKFPDYRRLLVPPKNSFVVNRKQCLDIVKSLIPTLDKSMAMSLSNLSLDNLPNVMVNARFLKDALEAGKDSIVRFLYGDNQEPIKIYTSEAFTVIVPIQENKNRRRY